MAFTKLTSFSKKPSDLPDVPSPNMTPDDIRSMWETPLDELKDNQNGLIDDLTANTSAGNLGAQNVLGQTSTIQAEMNKANNGLANHKISPTLDHPDKSVVESKLADKSVSRRTVQAGAIGTNELDPAILSQPATLFGQQAEFQKLSDRLDDIAINVKNYGAVGNANYYDSVSKNWYVDSGFTTLATDDTQAILNAVSDSTNIYFPDGNYLVKFDTSSDNSCFVYNNKNHIRLTGKGAKIIDGNTYTSNSPLLNIFKFVNCENIYVEINCDTIPLTDIHSQLGYYGSSFLYFENGCTNIKVDSDVKNVRYAVRSGDYEDYTKGSCRGFNIKLKTYSAGYPVAFYLADDIELNIVSEIQHRAIYLAGCNNVRGDVSYKGFTYANTAFLLTNTLTSADTGVQSTQTSRGCSFVDVNIINEGSTSDMSQSSIASIQMQWVCQGTKYENIKLNIQATTTDANASICGFLIISRANTYLTYYPYNWENYIAFRNIEITGSIDRSAQTQGNSTWGDIYIEGYDASDASYSHAPTFSNIILDKFTIIKPSNVAMNSNIIRIPKLIDVFSIRNVIASGINFAISAQNAIVKVTESVLGNVSSYDSILKLIQEDSTLGTVAGVTTLAVRDFGAVSGTWTPKLVGSTTPGTNTYSTQSGNYYKIGKLVKATFLITLSAKDANMAGNISISGLPFTAKDSNERAGLSLSFLSNVTLSTNYTQIIGNVSTTSINLYQAGNNIATGNVTPTNINATSAIWGTVVYEAIS